MVLPLKKMRKEPDPPVIFNEMRPVDSPGQLGVGLCETLKQEVVWPMIKYIHSWKIIVSMMRIPHIK
jgi:hypothetical protein